MSHSAPKVGSVFVGSGAEGRTGIRECYKLVRSVSQVQRLYAYGSEENAASLCPQFGSSETVIRPPVIHSVHF